MAAKWLPGGLQRLIWSNDPEEVMPLGCSNDPDEVMPPCLLLLRAASALILTCFTYNQGIFGSFERVFTYNHGKWAIFSCIFTYYPGFWSCPRLSWGFPEIS
jgi:hypothetical protein